MIVKQFTQKGEFRGAEGGVFWPNDWATEIFGEGLDYGRALAYLYRRFGYTIWGSDPYKEICEYILTTPMDGVGLSVRIKTHVDFAYFIEKDLERQCMVEKWRPVSEWRGRFIDWANQQGYCVVDFSGDAALINEAYTKWWDKNHPDTEYTDQSNEKMGALFHKENSDAWDKLINHYKTIEPQPNAAEAGEVGIRRRIKDALCFTMADLLRPVQVRDGYINILGSVGPGVEFDNEAPRFHAAGNGVPDWYVNKDLLWDFVEAVEKFGNGSAEVGMKKAMELMGNHFINTHKE